jgi:hypothetical protein
MRIKARRNYEGNREYAATFPDDFLEKIQPYITNNMPEYWIDIPGRQQSIGLTTSPETAYYL